MSNFSIIVDTRETHENSDNNNIMKTFDELNVPYTKEMLPVGDYVVTNKTNGAQCVIERKIINDFVLSVLNGRLNQEILKMNEAYSQSFLIIEGKWSDYYKDRAKLKRAKYVKNINAFTVNHRLGVMASISARTNTKILYTENQEQTIQLLISLANKLTDGKIYTAPVFKRAKTEEKIYLNVLTSFPNISEDKAQKIIDKYSTWPDFVTAISNKTFDMDGFGKVSVKMFENFINGV
jgi:ERCC4-type nuclease